jgi:hypothetical protein
MFTTMTVWATDLHVQYLAHHMLLLAIPAFLPAIVVVAVILYVALKDRANGDKSNAHQQSEPQTQSAIDGPSIGHSGPAILTTSPVAARRDLGAYDR